MHEVTLKLGKAPARPGAVKFKMTDYLVPSELPTPPAEFGHDVVVPEWQMLGNDQIGDCVIAGGLHETMLWRGNSARITTIDTAAAIKNYSAITGYKPGDEDTDRGTDMAEAASYRRKTGLVDSKGRHHKIGAYLAIEPGNIEQHLLAIYLFGAVGIGIEFPNTAMTQFNNRQPWDVVPHARIEGGHYISGVARRGGQFVVVTWGREQAMTDAFLTKYNDESYAYVSSEYLLHGKSPEGLNITQLKKDLASLPSS